LADETPVVFLDTAFFDILGGSGGYTFEVLAQNTSNPTEPEIQSILIKPIAP